MATRAPATRIAADKPVCSSMVRKPICPCRLIPTGCAGLVEINGKSYGLCYLAERDGATGDIQINGYRLMTGEGKVYDVPESLESCDCPDATYRSRRQVCKHAAALRQLRD